MGDKSLLVYEILNGRVWKPDFELRAIRSTTEFLSEYGRRRWSCWNTKRNIYRRGFVALIATVYCTWLVPISLMMET